MNKNIPTGHTVLHPKQTITDSSVCSGCPRLNLVPVPEKGKKEASKPKTTDMTTNSLWASAMRALW